MCVAFVIRKKVLRGNAEKEKLYGHYALTPVPDTRSLCTHVCVRETAYDCHGFCFPCRFEE